MTGSETEPVAGGQRRTRAVGDLAEHETDQEEAEPAERTRPRPTRPPRRSSTSTTRWCTARRWSISPRAGRPRVLHLPRRDGVRLRAGQVPADRPENSDDVAEGKQKALSFIEGRPTSELEALGEEIYDEYIADKIWPGTRDLAQMYLDAGQSGLAGDGDALRAGGHHRPPARPDGALGTVAKSVDGVFTGRLVGESCRAGKAHAVQALAIREG